MVMVYNVLMVAAIGFLWPLWLPLVLFRQKHRQPFGQRLWMPNLNGEKGATGGPRMRWTWIHALSVGEVLSAEPLVKKLAARNDAEPLVVTASTKTGFETAIRVLQSHVQAVRYFPFDLLFSVDRALEVIHPSRVVVVETDIWPNFLHRLHRREIPVHLVNARLSQRSFRGYKRLGCLMVPLLSNFSSICVQTAEDERRFNALGVRSNRIHTVGNIKFDQHPVELSPRDRESIASQVGASSSSLLWVAGSTHEGEEECLAEAFRQLRNAGIETSLVVAPRDPARATRVCGLLRSRGLKACTMGGESKRGVACDVVVVDRMGILRQLYPLADIAFVGGSLVDAGGHNPLEPASVGKPVLFGPHTEDFEWICRVLVEAGGAVRVHDTAQLFRQVRRLLTEGERRRAMGRIAYRVFSSHTGAVERTLDVIDRTPTTA